MRGAGTAETIVRTILAGLAIGSTAVASAQGDALFFDIGEPGRSSQPLGISGDGSVVVGSIQLGRNTPHAFTWTRESGRVEMPPLGAGPPPLNGLFARAYSASMNGSVVVGSSSGGPTILGDAVIWTDGIPEFLLLPDPDPDDGIFPAIFEAIDVSGNGRVVAGFDGFRWSADAGVDSIDMTIRGLSRDGTTLVGTGPTGSAVRWTEAIGLAELDPRDGDAHAASADGSVIVGEVIDNDQVRRAFRWTEADGMSTLGSLAGGPFPGVATDVSDDGKIAVGWFRPHREAAIWDPLNGVLDLRTYLHETFELDLSDRLLEMAMAVSADGRTIAGGGFGDDSWVVNLPHRSGDVARLDVRPGRQRNRIWAWSPVPFAVVLFGSEALDAHAVDRETLSFGPGEAAPIHAWDRFDIDRDGRDDFLMLYFAGALGLREDAAEVCLRGQTHPGMPFRACDAVRLEPGCGHGAALALIPPVLVVLRRRGAHA